MFHIHQYKNKDIKKITETLEKELAKITFLREDSLNSQQIELIKKVKRRRIKKKFCHHRIGSYFKQVI